jgi:hypothetical protein
MATLAELKTRIILAMNRDDLGTGGEAHQALIDAYTRAIEFYADELFWFNRLSTTVNTVAQTPTVTLPTGLRYGAVISYQGIPLQKVPLEDIQEYYNAQNLVYSLPVWWADDGNTVRLWPTPDAVYSLSIYGLADLGVPASSNAWTNEAYDLIEARSRMILYRDYFRDPEGAALAASAETEALGKLMRETRKRGVSPLRTDMQVRPRYNIYTG